MGFFGLVSLTFQTLLSSPQNDLVPENERRERAGGRQRERELETERERERERERLSSKEAFLVTGKLKVGAYL